MLRGDTNFQESRVSVGTGVGRNYMKVTITASVGLNGTNRDADVVAIQKALNDIPPSAGSNSTMKTGRLYQPSESKHRINVNR